jgi:ankyrin repeat protein
MLKIVYVLQQLLLDKVVVDRELLLNQINVEGLTPLHYACKYNNAEIVKVLRQELNCT